MKRIKIEENKRRNSLVSLKNELKSMYSKRFENEKRKELEKMKDFLILYEKELKKEIDDNSETEYERMQKQCLLDSKKEKEKNSINVSRF
jgi:hypothetical protein